MQGRTYKWEHVYWGSRFVRYPPLNLISTDVKMTLIITELLQNSFENLFNVLMKEFQSDEDGEEETGTFQ